MTTPEQAASIRIWREQEARDIEAAKAEVAQRYNLERNARFDCAWDIAWQLGHSSGIDEVKNYFADLIPLIIS